MTVLQLLAPAPVGGLESVVQALAAGHRARGLQVHVAAMLSPGDTEVPLLDELGRAGVYVHPVRIPARAYLRERRVTAALCRSIRPHVVHTHGYRPDLLDAGVARSLGIATVTTVHGFTGRNWKTRAYERMQRRAFRRFDAVAAVSRPIAHSLALDGVPSHRIHLVPNACGEVVAPIGRAAARRALGVGDDTVHIGWVGRLGREKGPDVFLHALARIAEPGWMASVVGDGEERETLRSLSRTLGLEPRVRWHGRVADARRLFPAFDVLVLSSRTEGTPLVLLEAMAAGVPIVATRVGGIPEVVSSRDALLVPPDDPAALAAAVGAVLCAPGDSAARAESARRRWEAERGLEPWLDRYLSIYRHVRPASSRRAEC